MRSRGIAAAVLIAVATVFVASASAGVGQPAVRVLKVKPLTVGGTHFAPAERVKVVASLAGTSETRYATATAAGAFTVRFTNTAAFDPCNADGLVRVIRKGAVTLSVKLLSARMCPVSSSGEGAGQAP
jgi:hypothetical protein